MPKTAAGGGEGEGGEGEGGGEAARADGVGGRRHTSLDGRVTAEKGKGLDGQRLPQGRVGGEPAPLWADEAAGKQRLEVEPRKDDEDDVVRKGKVVPTG